MAISLNLRNLLFVIHAIPPERLRGQLPNELELDLRQTPQGQRAFLATVSLEAGAAFPYILSGFRQVNYRIYVRHGQQPGILFLRSWVSSRTAAAAMNLAVHTEYAELKLSISDEPSPYAQYSVEGHASEQHLKIEAHADSTADYAPFGSRADAVTFLTHRLTGFATDHRKGTLSIVRVNHVMMDPLFAKVTSAQADVWSDAGILTSDEAMRPLIGLIQPQIEFEMNLPERLP